jgi:antitoxin component YwqK of YwqJK toxin-antitoxin module
MKYFLLILLTFFTTQIFAQSTILTDNNGDGIIEYKLVSDNNHTIEEGYYYNGMMYGTWKSYYPSGKLHMIAHFKNGLKHGTWYFYNENGKLTLEVVYKDNIKVSAVQHKYAEY